MKSKVLINPGRKRKIPRHFSWVDHRLVRNNYIERCSSDALALYLFLLTVGDYEGLSYYRDESILKYLSLSGKSSMAECRRELIDAELISYLGGYTVVRGSWAYLGRWLNRLDALWLKFQADV